MKFLLDENIPNEYKRSLKKYGYSDVKRINDFGKGLPDEKVFEIGYTEERIILTIDHDFFEYKKSDNFGIISISGKLKYPIDLLNNVFKQIEKDERLPVDYKNTFIRVTSKFFEITYKKKNKYKTTKCKHKES